MLKRPECEITFGVDKKLSGTTNWWPRPWRPRAHLLPISHRSTGYTPAWTRSTDWRPAYWTPGQAPRWRATWFRALCRRYSMVVRPWAVYRQLADYRIATW